MLKNIVTHDILYCHAIILKLLSLKNVKLMNSIYYVHSTSN